MDSPKISVVMCTYNSDKYIEDAIDSVLTQTFSNFEFIIWDDGSTDNTRAIVEQYNDKRIRYFYHENTGLGESLRLACKNVRGDYIARMDSDDISLPERFEKELAFLEKNKEYVLVSSAVYTMNEDGVITGRTFPYTKNLIIKDSFFIPTSFIVHPMVMMRRDAYFNSGEYLPIKKSQDVLFWSRLSKEGLFGNITTPLGKYRVLSSSLDHTINPYKQVLNSLLLKMVKDDVVKDEDIKLYNDIYSYSKKWMLKTEIHNSVLIQKKSIEERMFRFFKLLLGGKISEHLISGMKNMYYLITKISIIR